MLRFAQNDTYGHGAFPNSFGTHPFDLHLPVRCDALGAAGLDCAREATSGRWGRGWTQKLTSGYDRQLASNRKALTRLPEVFRYN